jgi:predicted transcriptional regulator
MAPNRAVFPTDREAEVMRILWQRKEARAAVIHQDFNELNEPEIAYSTLLTMLHRMVRKGYVKCSRAGTSNLYYPHLDIEYARIIAMHGVVTNYFNDDLGALQAWVERQRRPIRPRDQRTGRLL